MARVTRVAVLAAAALFALAGAARADGGERITSYGVDVTIRQDGIVHVREAIAYDFGGDQRHGIYRFIPYLTAAGSGHDREFPVSGIAVSSPDGAPSHLAVSRNGDDVQVKIGDPDRMVTGRHTYVISYDIRRALTPSHGSDEFAWNVVGVQWTVPISGIVATLHAPARLAGAACFAGPQASTAPCAAATRAGEVATFRQAGLEPGEGLTIEVKLPEGSVRTAPPLIVGHPSRLRALTPTPLGAGLAAGVLLLGLAWPWMAARRPRRAAAPPQSMAHDPACGLRPGQAGVVLAGDARPAHVAATVVDLAVRGHLHIEDVHDPRGRKRDWLLVRTEPPTATPPRRQPVLRYERTLLRALFKNRDRVRVTELAGTFAPVMTRVRRQLIRDATRRGWLHPKRHQATGRALGWCGAAICIAGLVPSQPPLGISFLGAMVIVAGAALSALAGRGQAQPLRRTAAGDRLYTQLRSLRQEMLRDRPHDECSPAEFLDRIAYAIAFGLLTEWASRFAAGEQPAAATGWLRPAPGGSHLSYSGWLFGLTDTLCSIPPSPSARVQLPGRTPWSSPGSGPGGGFGGGLVGGGGGGGGGGSW